MHELSLAQGICRTIAERVGSRPLAVIRLDVGALSGVNAGSLEFCLGEVARLEGLGEPAVAITEIPARMRCACGHEYEAEIIIEPCPACGGYEREVAAGTEFVVTSVDLQDDSEEPDGGRPETA